MKNQSTKTLLFLGALLLATTPVKAENPYDPSSYWFGFTAGAGVTLCQQAKAGMISKADGSQIFAGIRESMETNPEVTEFKKDFLRAVQVLKENPDCKGVIE